jgi:demethylmacrocin O-methyltransferase
MTVGSSIRRHLTHEQAARIKRFGAPLFSRDLTRLGRWYGTNKAGQKQAFTPIYQDHLGHRRHEPLRIFEIGIGGYERGPQSGGSSLRMWRSYFRRAEVVGLDLEPRDFREPRITTIVGDQTDEALLRRISERYGPFDLIVDDGSHVSAHIRASFRTLWPLLAPGGTYVIEDTQTSYMEDLGGGPPGTPGTSMELVKELCDRPNDIDDDLAALHVHRWIVLIDKGGGAEVEVPRPG